MFFLSIKDNYDPSNDEIYSLASLSRTSAPPFLMRSRPKAIRVNGRVLSISFQGEALLSQLAVVGGNKTGVFVHKVTEGSAAHTVGISPGAQIVEVGYSVSQHNFCFFHSSYSACTKVFLLFYR